MFIWLASYPKSGNTLVRSLLSSYFFSEDGIYNFELIKNIKQFPNIKLFELIVLHDNRGALYYTGSGSRAYLYILLFF